MKELHGGNFGLLIAYLLPGITALWGLSHFSPTLQAWLGSTATDMPTLSGFLYVTVAAVGAGLIASTIRWLVLDTVHHRTGIKRPDWDFSQFPEKAAAYDLLGEIHYRYYRVNNMLVALTFAYAASTIAAGLWPLCFNWQDLGFVVIEGLLFAGSRDTFRKYNQRLEMALARGNRKKIEKTNRLKSPRSSLQ